MTKFTTLVEKNNHTNRTIDILKLDIEDFEHETIPEMLNSGSLQNVKQILLEIHNNARREIQRYYSVYKLLVTNNFVSVAAEDWPHSCCAERNKEGRYEVYCFVFTFVNKRFLEN